MPGSGGFSELLDANQKALEFLVGLGMRETRGKVDANHLRKALEDRLGKLL